MRQILIKSIDWDSVLVHPVCAFFPNMDENTFEELSASIATNGQLEPILMDEQLTVIYDGRHRLKAIRQLNFPAINVVTFDELKSQFEHGQHLTIDEYIIDKNMRRRQLTEAARTKVRKELADYFRAQSAEAKKASQIPKGATGNPGGKRKAEVVYDRTPPEDRSAGKAYVKLAKATGVSERQARRELLIAKDERLTEEVNNGSLKAITAEAIIVARDHGLNHLEADIRSGKLTLNAVNKTIKEKEMSNASGYYATDLTQEEANREFEERVRHNWQEFRNSFDVDEWPEVIVLVSSWLKEKLRENETV